MRQFVLIGFCCSWWLALGVAFLVCDLHPGLFIIATTAIATLIPTRMRDVVPHSRLSALSLLIGVATGCATMIAIAGIVPVWLERIAFCGVGAVACVAHAKLGYELARVDGLRLAVALWCIQAAPYIPQSFTLGPAPVPNALGAVGLYVVTFFAGAVVSFIART